MLAQHNCFELAFKSRHWPFFETTPIDHSCSPSGSASSVRSGVGVGASAIARIALPLRPYFCYSNQQDPKHTHIHLIHLFTYSPYSHIHHIRPETRPYSPSFAMPLPLLRLPLPRQPLPLLRAGRTVCSTKLLARIATRSTPRIS